MIEISSVLDYLLFKFLVVVLGTQVDYNYVDNFDVIFDLDDFHIHKKVLMVPQSWCVVGWYVAVGFEVVTYSHLGIELLQLGMDLLEQALGQQHFSTQHHLQFPLH